ncbi:zinc finger protein 652-B-like isoform X2 [Esox lucius]|uniref:zinc finger protein 652-B-like isoform X2 n=1 Tax=Esox lucius TaxID=8010 RepID=UPI0014769A84|nr:zinc finger protein 652-B-like isoform X2 [Esox lucius]
MAEIRSLLNQRFTAPPPSPDDLIVNINCLLQLFRRCEQCRCENAIQINGDRTCLSVTQHCHSCNHLRTWTSNSSAARTTDIEYREKPQNSWVAEVQVALPSEDPDEAPPSEDPDEAPPSEDPDEAPPPEDPDEAPPSEDPDEAPPSEDPDEAPPSDVKVEAVELTGSLQMEVTEDQPPRLWGSGPSLIRWGEAEGNNGAEGRMTVTEVVLVSETDSVHSHEDKCLSLAEKKGGEESMVKSLGSKQLKKSTDQHPAIELTIYSTEPEDSESQTSQIDRQGEKNLMDRQGEKNLMDRQGEKNLMDRQGEKKLVAVDGFEGEGGVCELEGEEKLVMEEEDGESESDFNHKQEQAALRGSASDFHLEEEVTGSDSEFDPEEEIAARGRGRDRWGGGGRGRVGGNEGGRGKPLLKRTVETGMNVSAEHSAKSKHPKDDIVLCPECGVLYSTKLQEYRKCEHKFTARCQDCGKHFVNLQGLKIHRRRLHRQDCEFPCKFCLQPFRTRPDKLTHERSHIFTENVPPYCCVECPLRFDQILIRNRHLREHKSRRHICHTCYKEFDKAHLLERHELSHSDDKPYKCQVCQRAFAQASQLKSHLRVHTGERPFQCQRCDKSFNHNVSLKNHVRRYHSPDSGPDPDGGAGGGGQGEGEGVGKKMPRQQVQLTLWTEWAGADGAIRMEAQEKKRRCQCNNDLEPEEDKIKKT